MPEKMELRINKGHNSVQYVIYTCVCPKADRLCPRYACSIDIALRGIFLEPKAQQNFSNNAKTAEPFEIKNIEPKKNKKPQ